MQVAWDDAAPSAQSLAIPAAAQEMSAGRPTIHTWLRVWRHRTELDRRLLNGEAPAGDLAVRAEQLSRLRYRDRIAARLEAILAIGDLACHERAPSDVDVAGGNVMRTRRDIEMLAARLSGPEPVRPAGVAMCLWLLCDNDSPLYEPTADDQLGEAVRWALAALD